MYERGIAAAREAGDMQAAREMEVFLKRLAEGAQGGHLTGLRRAVAGDAPSLSVLAERTCRDAFGARNSPENVDLHCSRMFGAEIQQREIADSGLITTIAESSGRMIGFSQLRARARARASPQPARPN